MNTLLIIKKLTIFDNCQFGTLNCVELFPKMAQFWILYISVPSIYRIGY
jgi:hypothetical protein